VEEVAGFVRPILRMFPKWTEAEFAWDGEIGRMRVPSPIGLLDGALAIEGEGSWLTVRWRHWAERFRCTGLDRKDVEFGQLISLLAAIDEERAALVELFSGGEWLHSRIYEVKEDGELGAGGAQVGRMRLRRADRTEIWSWRGSYDSVA